MERVEKNFQPLAKAKKEKLKPFFCRIGSKQKIRKLILKNIPKHEIYVEPFLGGGAIFWAKDKSNYEILNDKDKFLINDYKLLKKIKNYELPDPNNFLNIKSINKFIETAPNTNINLLTKKILVRCNTYGSKGKGKIYKESNPMKKLEKLDLYKEKLKNVKLYNESYENILNKFDSKDTFFYLDPPYESSKTLYENHMIDYNQLRLLLDDLNGKWLLSINDSPNIRNIFKGYYIKQIVVNPSGNLAIGAEPRNELLIANYKLN